MLFYTFQYKPDTICPLIMSESEFFFKERHRTNINLAATFKDFKNICASFKGIKNIVEA